MRPAGWATAAAQCSPPVNGKSRHGIDDRHFEELTRGESLRLLASVPVGRVTFSHRALPTIRPVNHLVTSDQIIIRADLGTALSGEVEPYGGMVVAYEGDMLEAEDRAGWSVVVVGRARRITDQAAADRYRQALHRWVSGPTADVLAIQPEIVTGFRLAPRAGLKAAMNSAGPGRLS